MKCKVHMKIYKANTNQKAIRVVTSIPTKVNFKLKRFTTSVANGWFTKMIKQFQTSSLLRKEPGNKAKCWKS